MSFSFKPTQAEGVAEGDQNGASPVSTPATIPLGGMPLGGRVDPNSKRSILQVLLYILFGALVLVTIVLFSYQRYLISRIDAQKNILDEEDKALGALNLEGMRALSNRMKVVNQVLNEHASVSSAFIILEKSIENPVTYTKFSLIKGDGNKGYELVLSATAPSYKAVAQQLDTLKSDEYKKDFIPSLTFDGLSLDPSGRVNFNLKMPILIQGKLPELIFPSLETISEEPAPSTSSSTEVVAASSTPNY